jgi:hypothetical protein
MSNTYQSLVARSQTRVCLTEVSSHSLLPENKFLLLQSIAWDQQHHPQANHIIQVTSSSVFLPKKIVIFLTKKHAKFANAL